MLYLYARTWSAQASAAWDETSQHLRTALDEFEGALEASTGQHLRTALDHMATLQHAQHQQDPDPTAAELAELVGGMAEAGGPGVGPVLSQARQWLRRRQAQAGVQAHQAARIRELLGEAAAEHLRVVEGGARVLAGWGGALDPGLGTPAGEAAGPAGPARLAYLELERALARAAALTGWARDRAIRSVRSYAAQQIPSVRRAVARGRDPWAALELDGRTALAARALPELELGDLLRHETGPARAHLVRTELCTRLAAVLTPSGDGDQGPLWLGRLLAMLGRFVEEDALALTPPHTPEPEAGPDTAQLARILAGRATQAPAGLPVPSAAQLRELNALRACADPWLTMLQAYGLARLRTSVARLQWTMALGGSGGTRSGELAPATLVDVGATAAGTDPRGPAHTFLAARQDELVGLLKMVTSVYPPRVGAAGPCAALAARHLAPLPRADPAAVSGQGLDAPPSPATIELALRGPRAPMPPVHGEPSAAEQARTARLCFWRHWLNYHRRLALGEAPEARRPAYAVARTEQAGTLEALLERDAWAAEALRQTGVATVQAM